MSCDRASTFPDEDYSIGLPSSEIERQRCLKEMQTSDFHYDLPEELIANYPARQRSSSRLLCLDASTGKLLHRQFSELLDFLQPEDLLVFNNTRVIPARLFAQKESGGRVEILIERVLDDNRVMAQVRASKSPRRGSRLLFPVENGAIPGAEVEGRENEFFLLKFDAEVDLPALLVREGHMPLPPYIRRGDEEIDSERYQTIYAEKEGAVAAPTAGLHFDEDLFAAIRARGVDMAYLTLHVGAGTFQPIRVENVLEHQMHKELVDVDERVCQQVAACRARGGRVIAVGTTTVRSLESAAKDSRLEPFHGETDIFIYPGYEFQIVDAMVTNFHLSESTLLMLVSAFSEKDMLLRAYEEAVEQRYRFYSYGDAMFIYHSSDHS